MQSQFQFYLLCIFNLPAQSSSKLHRERVKMLSLCAFSAHIFNPDLDGTINVQIDCIFTHCFLYNIFIYIFGIELVGGGRMVKA